MVLILERLGIACEYHHHEVATAGQCEIDMRFTTLTRMADQLMAYKYVVRNVARRAGKTATFMPKPVFGDNGSGMHCHQSLWKDSKNADGRRGRIRRPLGDPHAHHVRRPDRARFLAARYWPRRRRRRTPTAASCPATRRPSISSTRSAAAPRASISRSARPLRRRQADRVSLPDATANPYLAFPRRCCSPGSTGSRRARPRRSGRLRPLRGVACQTCPRCPGRSRRPSPRSKRT